MAHRTVFGAGITLIAAMFPPRLAAQPKERESVPRCARRRPHGRTQRSVDFSVVLEAVLADPHDNVLSSVAPHQHRAGSRQPRVRCRLGSRFGSAPRVEFTLQEVLRRPDAKIRVVGDLQRPPPRSLGEAAPGVRLQAPGDPPEEELLVARPALLAKRLLVLLLELPDRHV